jgi:VanZ family protein
LIPAAIARGVPRAQQTVALVLLLAGLIAIAALTLVPSSESERISFWCVKCGERPGVDVLLNILLFVPFGAGLGLYGFRFAAALLAIVACTGLVESLQFLAVAGRYASMRDILANSIGALLGYTGGRHWRVVIAPELRAARALVIAAIACWLVIQGFTAWAMGPAMPGVQWWAQIRPEHDRYPGVFGGRVVALSVGSLSVRRSDRLDDTDAARVQLEAGEPLRVVVTDVRPAQRMAPIVILSAGPVHDVARWLQDGRDGVFSATVRGTLIGLRTPFVRIADVMPAAPDDTLALSGSYAGGWYRLRAEHPGGRWRRDLRGSASQGWAFLLPFPLYAFGAEVLLLTGLVLAAIWFVLGYWAARSTTPSRPLPAFAMIGAGLALGLALVPAIFDLPIAHWSEWLAALVGASAGSLAARLARGESPHIVSR